MRKKLNNLLFTFLVLLAVLLGVFIYIVINCTSYTTYIHLPDEEKFTGFEINYSEENIVSNEEPVYEDGYVKVTFHSLNQGNTFANLICYVENSPLETESFGFEFNVGLFNILYNGSDNIPDINGYPVYYVGAAVFFCIMAAYMIILFRKHLKQNIYSYNTVFNCALMILFSGLAAFFTLLSTYFILNYRDYQAHTMQDLTSKILMLIIFASIPFVLLYAVLMTISNISLIRHEGFRVTNALGIAISVAMILGIGGCFLLPALRDIFDLPIFTIYPVYTAVYAVICSLYVFFEVYLLSTTICALIAAKHLPAFDKDYIIILGCGIKKDGTLLPLLKGRVDKAIEFYHKQLAATGKKAVFVPSGGQGSDEIISEGEAMKRYLLEQGIPEELIMPETKSTNTLENMKFSKELIGDDDAKVAFSTTNYHVFRSGIFSNQAKLKAEGMGSKTKWYFWPNAFIREFIGLLVSQRKKIIVLAVLAALILATLALWTR